MCLKGSQNTSSITDDFQRGRYVLARGGAHQRQGLDPKGSRVQVRVHVFAYVCVRPRSQGDPRSECEFRSFVTGLITSTLRNVETMGCLDTEEGGLGTRQEGAGWRTGRGDMANFGTFAMFVITFYFIAISVGATDMVRDSSNWGILFVMLVRLPCSACLPPMIRLSLSIDRPPFVRLWRRPDLRWWTVALSLVSKLTHVTITRGINLRECSVRVKEYIEDSHAMSFSP